MIALHSRNDMLYYYQRELWIYNSLWVMGMFVIAMSLFGNKRFVRNKIDFFKYDFDIISFLQTTIKYKQYKSFHPRFQRILILNNIKF